MLLPKFLSRKISEEKSLDFLSQKSVVRPALLFLVLGDPQRNGKIRFFLRQNTFFPRILPWRCGSPNVLQTQVPKLCTDLDLGLLYIWIIGTYSRFARKNIFLVLGVCFPAALLERWLQVCRIKITFTKPPTNRFVSTTKKSLKCVVNWIPPRIRVRSKNIQPHLKHRPASSILQALSCRFCRLKLSNPSKLVISKKWKLRIALLVHNSQELFSDRP